ncbi:hypothetical protein PRIC1_014807 [Phytophthora ramorum]
MVTIQTHFLGRSVRYVCQNGTPCRLLAIANVLLLEGVVEGPDSVSAKNLMRLTHCGLCAGRGRQGTRRNDHDHR